MKIAVVGSRSFENYELLEQTLDEYQIKEIVSGGAKGADTLAEWYAKNKNIPTKVFLPEYEKFGRSAPIKRNQQIIEASDQVIAFWDGKSRGTKSTIDLAKKKGIDVIIIEY